MRQPIRLPGCRQRFARTVNQ